jgi:hypothetical protein
MNKHPRLHHSAYKITKGSLEKVVEVFSLLGCTVTYRPEREYRWAMVGQAGLRYDIQLVETDEPSLPITTSKIGTHVAFISDDPQAVIQKIEAWSKEYDIKFITDGWSDKERYVDLPELFINFVIEIMHTSVEDL